MSHDVNLTAPQRWLRRILIILGLLLFAFGVYLLVLDVWLTDNTSFNASQTFAMFQLMNSSGFYANYGELASQTVSAITDPVGRSAVMLVPVIANKAYFLAVGFALFLLGILLPRLLRLPDYLTGARKSHDTSAGESPYSAPEPVRYAPRGTSAGESPYTAPTPERNAPRRSPGMTGGAMLPPLDRAVGVPREGARATTPDAPAATAGDIPGGAGGSVCPACGMPADEGNAVCVYCGQPLPAQAFCRVCGKPLQPEDLFCAFCASPVEDAPAPVYDYPTPAPVYGAPSPTPPVGYRPPDKPAATKGMKIPTGL